MCTTIYSTADIFDQFNHLKPNLLEYRTQIICRQNSFSSIHIFHSMNFDFFFTLCTVCTTCVGTI